jgi:hypothetical protein
LLVSRRDGVRALMQVNAGMARVRMNDRLMNPIAGL